MLTIAEMVAKGQRKLQEKAAQMPTAFANSKQRAIAGYNTTPFNQTMKANYATGIQAATYHSPDPAKWARGFQEAVS